MKKITNHTEIREQKKANRRANRERKLAAYCFDCGSQVIRGRIVCPRCAASYTDA